MFFFFNQILVVLVFVRLPSARKLVQLQLDSAEKLPKLMPERSNARLLLLLPLEIEAFSHHMITDTSQP